MFHGHPARCGYPPLVRDAKTGNIQLGKLRQIMDLELSLPDLILGERSSSFQSAEARQKDRKWRKMHCTSTMGR
jgi:hypothetical protein